MDIGKIQVNIEGGLDYPFPPLIPVEQDFKRESLGDIASTLSSELEKLPASSISGKSIAITVGSRGIDGLVEIVSTLVGQLKKRGAKPFIVPSMGSHGGATAEGQIKVLSSYGITQKSTGACIRASMEVVEVGQLNDGTPLYIDRFASEADGIIIANKIKPHADFKANYESGLVKMLCIGLGKHKGAVTLHQHGFDRFHEILPNAAKVLLEKLPILCGLAILENAFDKLMHLEVISPQQILLREKELLEVAKASIGRLMFPRIDVLIIDEIGKNISGEGMDPNVTGRPGSGLPGFSDAPKIQKIVVLDLTPESHGNGVGVGLADVSTRHFLKKIDLGATYTNAITATILNPAKLPLIMNNDKEAIAVALKTCNRITPDTVRIVRIKNTLELHRIWISPSMLEDMENNENLKVDGDESPMEFDEFGQILPVEKQQ
jgi:hypothetical protein|tara:strand:+ start:10740 stop:12041 length:1302 start_codon:yes stop_codon:yes gene_type:complete